MGLGVQPTLSRISILDTFQNQVVRYRTVIGSIAELKPLVKYLESLRIEMAKKKPDKPNVVQLAKDLAVIEEKADAYQPQLKLLKIADSIFQDFKNIVTSLTVLNSLATVVLPNNPVGTLKKPASDSDKATVDPRQITLIENQNPHP